MDIIQPELPVIIQIAKIIGIGLIAFFLVTYILRYVEKKMNGNYLATPIKIIRRILRALIIISTFFYVASSLVKKNDLHILDENFELVKAIGIIILFTVIIASASRVVFTNLIEKIERRNDDSTKYYFFRTAIEFLIYSLGFIFVLISVPSLRVYANTLLGGAGVLAIVVGFAAQETFSNILAGVLIIFSKPFKIGDVIKVNDTMMGTVWDISLRHTVIRNFDNNMIVIPNSVINKEKIFNYDLGDERNLDRLEFNISYESDSDLAMKIMAEEAQNHKLNIDDRNEYEIERGVPRIVTRLTKITESAVVVRVYVWAKDFDSSFIMRCDLLDSIKKRFDEEGIDLPYPHRTITFKDSEKKGEILN